MTPVTWCTRIDHGVDRDVEVTLRLLIVTSDVCEIKVCLLTYFIHTTVNVAIAYNI